MKYKNEDKERKNQKKCIQVRVFFSHIFHHTCVSLKHPTNGSYSTPCVFIYIFKLVLCR